MRPREIAAWRALDRRQARLHENPAAIAGIAREVGTHLAVEFLKSETGYHVILGLLRAVKAYAGAGVSLARVPPALFDSAVKFVADGLGVRVPFTVTELTDTLLPLFFLPAQLEMGIGKLIEYLEKSGPGGWRTMTGAAEKVAVEKAAAEKAAAEKAAAEKAAAEKAAARRRGRRDRSSRGLGESRVGRPPAPNAHPSNRLKGATRMPIRLTESRLRQIIREEALRLLEGAPLALPSGSELEGNREIAGASDSAAEARVRGELAALVAGGLTPTEAAEKWMKGWVAKFPAHTPASHDVRLSQRKFVYGIVTDPLFIRQAKGARAPGWYGR
jgi:hypothetical protein